MKTTLTLALLLALGTFLSQESLASKTNRTQVSITYSSVPGGLHQASGSLGGTRYSSKSTTEADKGDQIGCSISAIHPGGNVDATPELILRCVAVKLKATNPELTCTSNNNQLIELAKAIGYTSSITFTTRSHNGECVSLLIDNNSQYYYK